MKDEIPAASGFLLDVRVLITVRGGSRSVTMGDMLAYGPGTVFELDEPADAPLDIFSGEKLIARGEIVVVGNKRGVRITTMINPDDKPRGAPEQELASR